MAADPRKLRTLFRRIAPALTSLLPGSCALCHGQTSGALCPVCRAGFWDDNAVRCEVCARRLPQTGMVLCGACLRSPPAFDATVVACDYAAPADLLVQDLKFRARLPLAAAFAQLLAEALQRQATCAPNLILPVPLSDTRLARRGFNQAAEIARELSRRTGIPWQSRLCIRVRDTPPQAGLPLSERRVNMRGAFAVPLGAGVRDELRGRHLLIVDDVMTTGHTLSELAACLKRQGAARVTNAVFARTPER
jgi:ComF family protein